VSEPSAKRTAFDKIAVQLSSVAGVHLGTGKRGFGAGALLANGRIFAMDRQGELVLRLPAERVNELVSTGAVRPFTAGKAKPLREWCTLEPGRQARPLALAREALSFAASSPSPTSTANLRRSRGKK
jgi:hypothetical protein